jgi:ribosome maturation factor RimP
MINEGNIQKVVDSELEGTDIVLVDIQISNSNNIKIILDSIKGVSIDECVKISRLIESNFDREEEDYQLEISSYGIGQAFILPLHYLKNINREVELYLKNGNTIKGVLKTVELTEDLKHLKQIGILNKKKIKEEGKKRKTEIEEIISVQNNEIQKAKLVPVF